MLWIAKHNPQSTSYCLTRNPTSNTSGMEEETNRGYSGNNVLTGFMLHVYQKEIQELNVCDEAFGSWGSQGIEVACKFWLSGVGAGKQEDLVCPLFQDKTQLRISL